MLKMTIHVWVSQRSPKCNFWEPLQANIDWKDKIRDLSTSLNNFGSLKNIPRGAAAFGRRPPLYVFWLPNFFELLLKVSYFFLSIHFGLPGLSTITFGGPWTYLTNNSHCKLRNLVTLQGQRSKTNGYLRIQDRMQIFEKEVPDGFKSRFDTLER